MEIPFILCLFLWRNFAQGTGFWWTAEHSCGSVQLQLFLTHRVLWPLVAMGTRYPIIPQGHPTTVRVYEIKFWRTWRGWKILKGRTRKIIQYSFSTLWRRFFEEISPFHFSSAQPLWCLESLSNWDPMHEHIFLSCWKEFIWSLYCTMKQV